MDLFFLLIVTLNKSTVGLKTNQIDAIYTEKPARTRSVSVRSFCTESKTRSDYCAVQISHYTCGSNGTALFDSASQVHYGAGVSSIVWLLISLCMKVHVWACRS